MSSNKRQASKRREATIKDVALEAGVSPMTVSRVINGKTSVRHTTRENIQRAIAKVNYRPNIGARGLKGAQSYQLLMIYNNPNVSWMGELLIGMMNTCRRIGYHLSIEGVGDFEDASVCASMSAEDIDSLIDSSRIDGVILPPPICFDRKVVEIISAQGIPCIRIAGTPMGSSKLRVGIDNCAAAYEITSHLIDLGHKNIAIIKGPDGYIASALRYEGFAAAMRDHGLELPVANIETGNFDVQSGNRCARKLLRLKNRPTAIFASNDEMAAGVLAAAQEKKIRVPGQLSVAGFDDAPIAHSVWPQLTTIRQPLRLMGERCVELLEAHIRQKNNGEDGTAPSRVLLDYQLMERQSTAECPADMRLD